MKASFLLAVLPALWLANADCQQQSTQTRYKGRLEITGICMNYTIRILEGNPPEGTVEKLWTDETTGIQYQDVFKLGNPCVFPATLKKGDSFYFTIDTIPPKPCTVCMAYYPTPSKSLSIKVTE